MSDGTEWIKNREDFTTFIQMILKEMETGELAPEPQSAEDLLRAIVAYTNDIGGLYKNMTSNATPEEPTWRIFAQILAGALIYE